MEDRIAELEKRVEKLEKSQTIKTDKSAPVFQKNDERLEELIKAFSKRKPVIY